MSRYTVLAVVIVALVVVGCAKKPEPAAAPPNAPVAASGTQQEGAGTPPAPAPADTVASAAPPAVAPDVVSSVADIPDYPGANRFPVEVKAKNEHGFTRRTSVRMSTRDTLGDAPRCG
jgi:hypothetical protein